MGVVNALWMSAQNLFPVLRKQRVVRIGFDIFIGLKVPDETVSVIQNQGNAVRAVTDRRDDFAFNAELFQKRSASIRGKNHRAGRIDGRIFPLFPGEDIVRSVNRFHLRIYQKQLNPPLLKLTDQTAMAKEIILIN